MRRSLTLFLSLCLSSLPLSLAAGEKTAEKPPALARELYLFNWENYLKPAILEAFQKEFGVRVIEDHFSSNEEMLAKLQAGGGGYDVIVPTDYTVRTLIREDRLAPLNPEHLPNLKNIEARFLNPAYDPGNRFSVPYLWGVTGIGCSRKAVMPPPTSWHDLFGPSTLKKYPGRISMLNDMREALGAGRALIDPKLDSARYTVPAGVKLYSVEDLGPAGQWYERAWMEVKAD
jgi:spermidine/putrescine transport system substrate-binding protein